MEFLISMSPPPLRFDVTPIFEVNRGQMRPAEVTEETFPIDKKAKKREIPIQS